MFRNKMYDMSNEDASVTFLFIWLSFKGVPAAAAFSGEVSCNAVGNLLLVETAFRTTTSFLHPLNISNGVGRASSTTATPCMMNVKYSITTRRLSKVFIPGFSIAKGPIRWLLSTYIPVTTVSSRNIVHEQ